MTPRLVRQATAWVHIQLGLESRLELPFYFPIHGMGDGGCCTEPALIHILLLVLMMAFGVIDRCSASSISSDRFRL